MKQKPHRLLPQTVVKSPTGETGTLLRLGFNTAGVSGWAVMFAGEKLARFVSCAELQDYDIV